MYCIICDQQIYQEGPLNWLCHCFFWIFILIGLKVWGYPILLLSWLVNLNLSCIVFQDGQTYFKNLAVSRPQDFKSIFGHFSTFCMKGLKNKPSMSDKWKCISPLILFYDWFPRSFDLHTAFLPRSGKSTPNDKYLPEPIKKDQKFKKITAQVTLIYS